MDVNTYKCMQSFTHTRVHVSARSLAHALTKHLNSHITLTNLHVHTTHAYKLKKQQIRAYLFK